MFWVYFFVQAIEVLCAVLIVKNIAKAFKICISFSELLFFTVAAGILPLIAVFCFPSFSSVLSVPMLALIIFILLLLLSSSLSMKSIGVKKSLLSTLVILLLTVCTIAIMQLFSLKYFGNDLLLYNLKNELESTLYGVTYHFPIKHKRGDIVIHKHEVFDNVLIRSRIIGLPEDTVTITNANTVLVNGVQIDEPYVFGETKIYPGNEPVSYTVPPGNYYLLGDSRETAKDSRHLGPFEEQEIIGTFYKAPDFVQSIIANFIQRKNSV